LDDVLIIEHIINHASPGACSLLGTFGGGLGWEKIVFNAYDNYQNLSHPFHHRSGVGWDGLQQVHLDDVFYK